MTGFIKHIEYVMQIYDIFLNTPKLFRKKIFFATQGFPKKKIAGNKTVGWHV